MRQSTLTSGRAILSRGRAVCPKCGKRLCDVASDASAAGITLWCRLCREPVALELGLAHN